MLDDSDKNVALVLPFIMSCNERKKIIRVVTPIRYYASVFGLEPFCSF